MPVQPTESNLTFYKNWEDNQTADADYSAGSATGTFSVTRSSSAPATYCTSDGTVTSLTTSNVGRYTQGYWNDSGFFTKKGIIFEGASTNLVPQSNLTSDATWTLTNGTASNTDAGSSSPDGTATAPSFTATSANATILLTTSVTARTFSVWLKRKTGSGTVEITANGGTTWTAVTLPASGWGRFQVTATSASQKCGVRVVTSGDEIYMWGAQFEAKPFATTLIPTAGSSRTRNAESYTFANASNRTAATESIFYKIVPFFNGSQLADAGTNYPDIFMTQTKERGFRCNQDNDSWYFYPNATDSSGAATTPGTAMVAHASTVLTGVCIATTGNPNFARAQDGAGYTTNNTDWTSPAWGTNFNIGSGSGGSFWGIIQAVAIFSDAKSSTDITAITNELNASLLKETNLERRSFRGVFRGVMR